MSAIAVALLALVACVAAKHAPLPNLPNFTGYIVTAQWDGRTVPDVQWALDVTRQDTEFRMQQELKFQKLIPTTVGPALSPTYTAFDAASRTYFTTVVRSNSTASLWGMTISNDVSTSTPLAPVEVRYQFSLNNYMVGLEVWNNNSVLVPLAFFLDGTILSIDPATGNTALFGKLFADPTQFKATTAITLNAANNLVYAVVQAAQGNKPRVVVTYGLASGAVSTTAIQALANFNAELEQPFEVNYIPSLHVLVVFYTGPFDQLVYTDPSSGMTSFAVENLMDYELEFYFDDFLEDDDTWANSAFDAKNNFLYFQCTQVTSSDDETTTALCRVPITTRDKNFLIPNVCISPMTYGYAGMQYVQVVSQ